ncbi:MAG: hypothetical protein FWD35_02000, partial [Oscillospiraceae bacterium]|nr:hypothetical protein [Oscillospiraceae bacterium]
MKKAIALLTAVILLATACTEQEPTQQQSEAIIDETVATRGTRPIELPFTDVDEPTPTTEESHILRPFQRMRSLSGESNVFVGELASNETERWNGFSDYMNTYVAQFRWLSTTLYAEGIMHERAWNEQYKNVFDMTYEEAIQAYNTKFDSFEYVTTEVWNSIDCEIFHAYAEITHGQPVWGWRLNSSNEPNRPEFLEVLRHFNVTQDEFQREHER